MFPIAHRRKNIGDCRPESHRRRHHVAAREIRLPRGRNAMMSRSSAPRSLLLAGAFFGAFTLAAAAQQPATPPAAGAAPAAAPALPPGSPLIGRPAGNEAAAKLAPIAPPPIAAAPDKLPTAKLKVPAGFNIEVYAAGMANARSLARRRQGHGVRRQPPRRQRLCGHQQGRQAGGQDDRVGPLSAERHRVQERHALHRRTVEGLQGRQDRGQSRQPAEADHDLRQSAEGRSPWLEVHRHRSRQQALCSGRAARQQRAATTTRTARSGG